MSHVTYLQLKNYALLLWNSHVTGHPVVWFVKYGNTIYTPYKASLWPGHSYLRDNLGHMAHPNCKANGNSSGKLNGEECVGN